MSGGRLDPCKIEISFLDILFLFFYDFIKKRAGKDEMDWGALTSPSLVSMVHRLPEMGKTCFFWLK